LTFVGVYAVHFRAPLRVYHVFGVSPLTFGNVVEVRRQRCVDARD
jgi:hypothetical protein